MPEGSQAVVNPATVTDDELTCLMICARGESLAAIGRWEKPVDALVERGLLRRGDKFNNFITEAGRAAIAQRDRQDDESLREVLTAAAQTRNVQSQMQDFVQQAAKLLADGSKASALVTGDAPEMAARKWSALIL